ncbi:MAG TPA: hypothetical protein DCL41_00065 [Bdellovibrionales bacterium]|nr:hypothetical protein [Pseudobdellovibrionaceae bacterium]HAG90231.1 hypothetical protein [Bdellovibrionales bacterium]|tara:strand:- start:3587 stop:4213 length:627 start_codon:yes stop_codon:yes gene_type:complete
MKILILVSLFFVISSCATLSKEECVTMDWEQRGKVDALEGKTSDVFVDYTKTCAKHGIQPAQEGYMKGRAEGLKHFCTYENGQQFGLKGNNYEGVCPMEMEPAFMRGYEIGRKEFLLKVKEQELKEREEELKRKEEEAEAHHAILTRIQTRQCSLDSDCDIDGDCSFGKCKNSGASCTFDSDCTIEGDCSSETVCANGDCASVNTCHY